MYKFLQPSCVLCNVYIGWPLDDFRSPKDSVSCVFLVGKKRVNCIGYPLDKPKPVGTYIDIHTSTFGDEISLTKNLKVV